MSLGGESAQVCPIEVERHLKQKPLHPFTCCFDSDMIAPDCIAKTFFFFLGVIAPFFVRVFWWLWPQLIGHAASDQTERRLGYAIGISPVHTPPVTSSCWVKSAVFYQARTHSQIHPTILLELEKLSEYQQVLSQWNAAALPARGHDVHPLLLGCCTKASLIDRMIYRMYWWFKSDFFQNKSSIVQASEGGLEANVNHP